MLPSSLRVARRLLSFTTTTSPLRFFRRPSSSLSPPPRRAYPCPYPLAPTARATRRRLATRRTVVPDPAVRHALKADVTPAARPLDVRPLPTDAAGRVLLKCLSLPELERWVRDVLHEKPFRARQLWRWLYADARLAASFDEMTDLSKSFREQLAAVARVDVLGLDAVHESEDGTKKVMFRLDGGGVIETVLIPADGRTTVCISSQWGCALNCQFCLTGRTGFKRSLSQGEIVDQVVQARRLFGNHHNRICNVVFMGEGEPAHNVDNVLGAVETLLDGQGLAFSHNKVTVSSSGLVPEIRRLATECKANLAISLHATNDDLRSWLMPINRKYPLADLMGALRDVFPRQAARQQKVFFQYVMLKGVNDSLQDARELLRLTARVPCKVNLIHFNTHEGTEFEASDEETMRAFQDFLVKKGMLVTIRKSRGDDKMMACGQLGKLGPVQAPRMRVPDKFAHVVNARSATTTTTTTTTTTD